VGSGPGRDRVEALIARLGLGGRCEFAGSLCYAEMPRAYRSADVFVLPSIAMPDWQEQFGMALIEAMACGVPAIATYSGAIAEIAGEAAVLCQPNDFTALYEALGKLIRDEARRRELGEAGRARVLKCFTLARYVEALRQVYKDMGLPVA
jgi:glycosyltransferase involved in cell wall biosynthesis